MEIIYRRALPSDAEFLAELRWDFRYNSRAGQTVVSRVEFQAIFSAFIAQALERSEWLVWVAEQTGEIIAHVYLHVFQKLPNPYALESYLGYISNVYTKPEFRSRGVGATLMAQVTDWAKQQGRMDVLFLWRSEESQVFYERQGFKTNPHMMEYEVPGE